MINLKKASTYIGFGITLILILTLFIYLSFYVQPKISFNVKIGEVSNTDYSRILSNNQIPLPHDKDKFVNVKVQIKVNSPFFLIRRVRIEKDNLPLFFKSTKNVQILSGGNLEDSKGTEYDDSIELFLGNTTKEDLAKMLNGYKVKITWQDFLKHNYIRILYFEDFLN